MHRVPKAPTHSKFVPHAVLLGLAMTVLTACGTHASRVDATPPKRFDMVATIMVDTTITRAEVETAHGGTVLSFRPEAGFVVLGFDEGEGVLSPRTAAAVD